MGTNRNISIMKSVRRNAGPRENIYYLGVLGVVRVVITERKYKHNTHTHIYTHQYTYMYMYKWYATSL